jgi:transposase-like protein
MVHFYRNVFSHVPATKVREGSHLLKAIRAQESRDTTENWAKAIIDELRAGKMSKAVEQGAAEAAIAAMKEGNGQPPLGGPS